MASSIQPIPQGFHTVTPHLVIRGAAKAIEFYKKAFGAQEMGVMPMPNDPSKVMHAQIKIGGSMVMLADEFEGCGVSGPDGSGNTPVTLHLYVPDVDATIAQAVQAGAKVAMPAADMFWGDRYGQVIDPFGHRWSVATHKHDYTPEQMMKGAAEMFEQHEKAHA